MADDAVTSGLYLHEKTETMPGVKVLRVTREGVEETWVDADDFMRVQRERDELRRTVALINSCRVEGELPSPVVRLLERAGFDLDGARVMAQIVAQFRS